jgi:hypothetical protein
MELTLRGEQRQQSFTSARETCAQFNFCLDTPNWKSTMRYFGIEVDDALEMAEETDF